MPAAARGGRDRVSIWVRERELYAHAVRRGLVGLCRPEGSRRGRPPRGEYVPEIRNRPRGSFRPIAGLHRLAISGCQDSSRRPEGEAGADGRSRPKAEEMDLKGASLCFCHTEHDSSHIENGLLRAGSGLVPSSPSDGLALDTIFRPGMPPYLGVDGQRRLKPVMDSVRDALADSSGVSAGSLRLSGVVPDLQRSPETPK